MRGRNGRADDEHAHGPAHGPGMAAAESAARANHRAGSVTPRELERWLIGEQLAVVADGRLHPTSRARSSSAVASRSTPPVRKTTRAISFPRDVAPAEARNPTARTAPLSGPNVPKICPQKEDLAGSSPIDSPEGAYLSRS